MIEKTDDIAACRAIRHEVFVIEQHVPEAEEWDGRDGEAIHLIARDDSGAPIGTARLLLEGATGKIGRVAVLKAARGSGTGAALIRASLQELAGIQGITRAKLGAQTHAIGFYEKLGFSAYGPEYLDAGIAHRDMTQEL
ncbi:GNAT family N-acetyltransferase [Paracoccus shanxieyensis]|uniref:GNAT family N-acetyltransferase n=1 Tax=Paracoccus shanxieyensis TaxID=2675752 RepID=A0A6L6IZJ9_9RHOB|nr:GNAT family N-acetyltransferase [Paracoccus shanxieyensis]MTH65703.1 GNAT family N-acetyltransferase [Paracoccus shanxieyensis]MTH88922.1 GNAT family N-acetyltransferase [Paracoccus shanxieyensis]